MADTPFEIPQTLRDAAEQNLKQAHAAYEQLTDFVTKAIDAWMEAMPASYMVTGLKDVRDRASEIAKKNADSAFALIEKIAKAQNFQEILTLQMQFAQDRMQAFAAHSALRFLWLSFEAWVVPSAFNIVEETFVAKRPSSLGTFALAFRQVE